MVQKCSVYNCRSVAARPVRNEPDNGIRFFRIPTWRQHQGDQMKELTKRRRMAWVEAVGRENITFDDIPANARVCSLHFHKGRPAGEMYEFDPDWAPSLHLGHAEHRNKRRRTGPATAPDVEDHPDVEVEAQANGEAAQEQHVNDDDAAPPPDLVASLCSEINRLLEENRSLKAQVCQMQSVNAAKWGECRFCSSLRDEINQLVSEKRELAVKLSEQHQLDSNFLESDDRRVKYYTGFANYVMFSAVLTQVLPVLPQAGRKLNPFQMFFLTLMRLRLNFPRQHLAHLFSVSENTVTTVFSSTISAMYTKFGAFVNWPERDALAATMPHQFVEVFGTKVVVVIDSFEICTDRPSKKSQAETSSKGKDSNTLKYLIGTTPNGSISFISKGWEGSSSDKEVTENCGIIDKLLPGDMVLAGRGLDKDSVGFVWAEVEAPASSGQRSRLRAVDVEKPQDVAPLRVHVERVIKTLRNSYTYLNGTIPAQMVVPLEGQEITTLDQIVHVCCALSNMVSGSVVKLP